MTIKHCLAIFLFGFSALLLNAQGNKAPENWFTLDPTKDQVNGTGSDEALKMLKEKGKKGQTVIVAVLDSGVDYEHEDLKDIMWVNPGEIPGNGKDDDGNGFSDCADFNCRISPSVSVCNAEKTQTTCHDSTDNDGNGKADCADTTCLASPFVSCP